MALRSTPPVTFEAYSTSVTISRVTQRSAFVLHVRPDKLDEYVQAHGSVWPEMLDALRGAGIRNYSIFRSGNDVFGYFEADDLAAAELYLSQQEVCTRWQDHMAGL